MQFTFRLKQKPFLFGIGLFFTTSGSSPFLIINALCSSSYSSKDVEISEGVGSRTFASFSDFFVKKHAAKEIRIPTNE